MMRSTRNLTFCLCLALLTVPAFGAGVITNGIDTWTTTDDGSSFMDFAEEPIPAGFFCLGSEPFAGRIAWEGEPLVSVPADALGLADTIVQRLDDAVFDRDGVATTRLQVRALSLRSLQPIQTSCGAFHVTAGLHGVQPTTEMTIRQTKADAGTFDATLAMNVRLTFTPARATKAADSPRGRMAVPVDRPWATRSLTVERPVELTTLATPWQSDQPETNLAGQIGGFVMLDTDNDGHADTFVPGQSAFHPRGGGAMQKLIADLCFSDGSEPVGTVCHTDPRTNKCHCTYP